MIAINYQALDLVKKNVDRRSLYLKEPPTEHLLLAKNTLRTLFSSRLLVSINCTGSIAYMLRIVNRFCENLSQSHISGNRYDTCLYERLLWEFLSTGLL
jgi:hypothetical protein